MSLRVREATSYDIAPLAEDMRVEDINEINANSGLNPLVALSLAYTHSAKCFTIVNNKDEVCGMYGVINDKVYPVQVGLVWMLASPKLLEHKRYFIRHCRKYIKPIEEGYDLLYNYVDERNAVHIKWIEWCGFKVIKRHLEYGVEQLPFLEFVRINLDNVRHFTSTNSG